jgi:hypothetical protein
MTSLIKGRRGLFCLVLAFALLGLALAGCRKQEGGGGGGGADGGAK